MSNLQRQGEGEEGQANRENEEQRNKKMKNCRAVIGKESTNRVTCGQLQGRWTADRGPTYTNTGHPTTSYDPSPQCGAVLYCGEACLRADWKRCPDDVSHRFWCPRLAAFMERAGELATLPFTYTAGIIRRSEWMGELDPGLWNRVLGLKVKCLLFQSLDPWSNS